MAIEQLNLAQASSAEAVLADGSTVELETFACTIEWFGKAYDTQVVANDSSYPLPGTMLLAGHMLQINYDSGVLSIE